MDGKNQLSDPMAFRDSRVIPIRPNDLLRVRGKRRTPSPSCNKVACKLLLPSAELPLPLFYSGVPRTAEVRTGRMTNSLIRGCPSRHLDANLHSILPESIRRPDANHS